MNILDFVILILFNLVVPDQFISSVEVLHINIRVASEDIHCLIVLCGLNSCSILVMLSPIARTRTLLEAL